MSRPAKREYLKAIHSRYQQSSRAEKPQILDEFCQVCWEKTGPAKARVSKTKRGIRERDKAEKEMTGTVHRNSL
jgi:hypothetical protein